MQVSVKELRTQPGRIISMAGSGNDITITMRGKPAARIVPLDYAPAPENGELAAFGMWKDREDMKDPSEFVSGLRKGRGL
ncbi:MAG: type II toxin-antitoxin system prevent-host-death family antitoxin [Clostridiales Family XIII bacterium]|nr:type II toxin-antitoxin system prevent-host-death family antitoxin [Clostridiales Family XIII bacterium]